MPVRGSTLKKRAAAHRPKTRSMSALTKTKRQAAAAKARAAKRKSLSPIKEGGAMNMSGRMNMSGSNNYYTNNNINKMKANQNKQNYNEYMRNPDPREEKSMWYN